MMEENSDERFICIWLDNQLIRSEDYIDAQDELRSYIKNFQSFNNSNECIDFITDIIDKKVFLITSNILGKILVPLIYLCEQIDSIYIFNINKSSNNDWTKDYKKIKGIYHDFKLICKQFKYDKNEYENDPISISFISSTDINSHDIKRQDPSFMYFQLLKEIILNDCLMESEEETKNDMLNYCRKIYSDNIINLDIINQFEKDFIPELSIYWYTKECFLYKILNKALWTLQTDILYKLRYFLRHLYQQILSQAEIQRQNLSSMIVYRGQNMSLNQIEKLKENLGGFLSFNNFLSTSLKRDIALNFLWGSDIGVLFEIHIDPTIQNFPIINIENISYLEKTDCEQELLFIIGSVFRIIRIDKHKNYYSVQLILSNDIDQQLSEYTKRTRESTRSPHSFLSLLKLMNELSEYSSVDKFAQILHDDIGLSTNPLLLGAVHHIFGLIYYSRGQYKESLEHSHKALNINSSYLPANHIMLTPTYNNIGCVHLARNEYNKALEFQQLALDCQLNSGETNVSLIILYTNNIGKIYGHQEKYSESIVQHKRALQLQIESLGENDPSIKDTYNLISTMYQNQGDFKQANFYREKAVSLQKKTSELDPSISADFSIENGTTCLSKNQYQDALNHFKHALNIQQQYFLPNHPSIAKTYNHIASTYDKQDQFEDALQYYNKALDIEQISLSDDHLSIATSFFNVSKTYVSLKRWSNALEYSLKAVEQLKKKIQVDINTLASFIHYVGYIYHEQEQYQEALIYYQEANELYSMDLLEDDPSLFAVYHRTARTYYQLEMYNEALIFYQKTFNIGLKILPDNEKQIATIYLDLSHTYLALKQYDESLIAIEQAIEQLRKTLPNNHPEVVQYRVHLDIVKQKQLSRNNYY